MRGADRLKGRPFVFNLDCNDVDASAPPGNAQKWIRDWYARAFAAGAGVFVADVATPDVVETKDTPTGEICGARFVEKQRDKSASGGGAPVHDPDDHPERFRSLQWYRTIAELTAQGTDVLHLACQEGRKAGGIILGGMRMSDAHQGTCWRAKSDDPLVSQFLMDHPEWCNTWDAEPVMLALSGRLDATLNYAVPEVRAHRLQILREMATNYDIDGLELDWMRWCRHFPAGRQREYLDVLTGFVGQVRAMLDGVARKKGVERMILGHRVPVTLEESLNIGCDVGTWAKKGYADFLAPMDFLYNDLNLRSDEFVRAVGGAECLVYPGFGSTGYSFGHLSPPYDYRTGKRRPVAMRSLEQFRATAANWYAWGAAGGSCFNMYLWQPEFQEFYAQAIAILSDPKKALAGPRHYVYLPVWKDRSLPEHSSYLGPTGRHNAQILTFGADTVGRRQAFVFRMADGRSGEKIRGLLRFRIYDATLEDAFKIDLNGAPVAPEKLNVEYQPEGEAWEEPSGPKGLPRCGVQEGFDAKGPFVWPANVRFDVALGDCPPFKGDNELGITLVKKNPSAEKHPVMEALEVRVLG